MMIKSALFCFALALAGTAFAQAPSGAPQGAPPASQGQPPPPPPQQQQPPPTQQPPVVQKPVQPTEPEPTPVKEDTSKKKNVIQTVKTSEKAEAGKKKVKAMYAVFDTSMGKIKCKLFMDRAPKAVDNFVGLAEGTKEWKDPVSFEKKKSHFYDGLTFHRIIKKFMIQGGDPEGTGMGGPGFEFADELNPDLTFDKGGILAMANRGRNTNGSQFFITTDPATWLNGGYTIFGEVTEGMDVVRKISEVPTDKTNDKPLKPVKINKVTIIRK